MNRHEPTPKYTFPEHPVSCIEPGLAIHFPYDNIHVSMLFSQIIPPSPSPTESKRLFYTSVSLLLSRTQGYLIDILIFTLRREDQIEFRGVLVQEKLSLKIGRYLVISVVCVMQLLCSGLKHDYPMSYFCLNLSPTQNDLI